MPADLGAHAGRELVALHRPHDEIVDAEVEPAHHARPVGIFGDQQDRQPARLLQRAHLRAGAQRIEIAQRHADDRQLVVAAGHACARIGRGCAARRPLCIGVGSCGCARRSADRCRRGGCGRLRSWPRPWRASRPRWRSPGRSGARARNSSVSALSRTSAFDARHQLHVVDGLGEEVVGPGAQTLHAVGGLVERGDHHHRNVGGTRRPP